MVPAVLLLSVGAALGGLAVLPQAGSAVAVTAAAASSPMVLVEPRQPVANSRDLALLDAPAVPVPTRAPVRATRARRLAPPPAPLWVRPGVGHLTSSYKWRWGRMHTGIDLAGPFGSPIRAVTAGKVLEAGYESGYGYIVKLEHADGTITYYAHCSKLRVDAGERVTAGEQIAEEGNTGHSTGPHLHFEVRVDGNPINPIPWLAAHGIEV
jgi:murein DD-endopeptidase MepM/ murein hydrolase activator NlpD